MIPLHEVQDPEKVQQLAASMGSNGWEGAPLVVWPIYNELVTGTHRYAAAHDVLGWDDSEIPTIAIEDVFFEADLDFEALVNEEAENGWYGNPFGYSFLKVLEKLPEELREKYGIDMH